MPSIELEAGVYYGVFNNDAEESEPPVAIFNTQHEAQAYQTLIDGNSPCTPFVVHRCEMEITYYTEEISDA